MGGKAAGALMMRSSWTSAQLRAALVALAAVAGLSGCAAVQSSASNGGPAAPTDISQRVDLRVELASAYWQRGQFSVALQEAEHALSIAPDSVAALHVKILSQLSMGEVAQAHVTLDRALALAPNDRSLLQSQAWSMCINGNEEAGMEALAALPTGELAFQNTMLLAQCAAGFDVVRADRLFTSGRQRWPEVEAVALLWADFQMSQGDWSGLMTQMRRFNEGPAATTRTLSLQAHAERVMAERGESRQPSAHTPGSGVVHDAISRGKVDD